MRAFLVSYDLKVPGRDYSGLYGAIRLSGRWWHYLDSTWIIVTTESAQQISQRLKPHIDNNDYILIIEVVNNIGGWLPKDAWEWINKNVPRR